MQPKHNTASLSFPFVFFFFQTAVEESGDIVSFCGFAELKKVVGRQWTEKCSFESLCKNRKYVTHLLADVILIKPQPSSVPMCMFKGVVFLQRNKYPHPAIDQKRDLITNSLYHTFTCELLNRVFFFKILSLIR